MVALETNKKKLTIFFILLAFSQVTKTNSPCAKIASFPATIWDSKPVEVGREFISATANVLGYISVFNAWAGLFLWDDLAKKPPSSFRNDTAGTWFLRNNLYGLGLFMLAATLKIKNKKKSNKTAYLTLLQK